MPIDPWLPRAAAQRPERIALEAPEGALTYAQLLAAARIDVAPGGRVALALAPGLEFAVALHACLLARAAAMPVDPRLGEAERAALLASADLVVDGPLPGCGAAAPVAPDDGDTALVVHTSGTTAAPRPVELSFGNVQANALGSAVALGLDPDERWLCPLPLSHVGGLMVLLRSAIYGTRAVLGGAERATGDDITVVSLVPTQLRRLLAAGARPGARLRVALLGGAAATPDLLEEARAAGWPVRATYGLTQACSQVAVDGRPLPGLAVTLADDGEILVEGPTVVRRRRPAHGRPRPLRPRRPAGDRRPQGRHDRHRRRERRPRRGRGGAARAPRRRRRRRVRPPGPGVGRGGHGERRAARARRPAGAARRGSRAGSRASRCPRRSR